MADRDPILSDRFGTEESWTLPVAERLGAYAATSRD